MKKLFLIIVLFLGFLTVKAQVFTPLDTTISGIRYKFYVNSISYSLNGDSTFTYRGTCEYKPAKKTYYTTFEGTIKGKLITVVVNTNQCRFEFSRSQLKAILKSNALTLIGEDPAMTLK